MQSSLRFLLLFSMVALATSCSQQRPKSDYLGPRYEAVAWLASNPNPHPFASNRFASAGDALSLVETLYDSGAVEVLITGVYEEDWRIEAEGGPYAATLILRLPVEAGARRRLFDLANEEAEQGGFSRVRDTGQDELLLWWD
jgi:hypothetical protein